MIKIVLLCISIVIFNQVAAQKSTLNQRKLISEDNEQNRKAIGGQVQQQGAAKSGTFQLILSDINHQFALNDSFLIWVENSRKEIDDQFIRIDENIMLFLPAKKTIKTEGFELLQEVTVKRN